MNREGSHLAPAGDRPTLAGRCASSGSRTRLGGTFAHTTTIRPATYPACMKGLRTVSLAAIVVGALLLVGTLATPTCRNYAGTARDSGYPCKLQRSSGSTEFIWSRTSSTSIPRAEVVAIIVVGIGLVAYRRGRRRSPAP
jgi:hypothetical protein